MIEIYIGPVVFSCIGTFDTIPTRILFNAKGQHVCLSNLLSEGYGGIPYDLCCSCHACE